MNNEYHTIEDLLFDKSFRDWILNRTDANNFWEQWTKNNPEKSDIINYAKAILYTISVRNTEITEEEIEYEINKVISEMDMDMVDDETMEVNATGLLITKYKKSICIAVLTIAILLGTGYLMVEYNYKIKSSQNAKQISKEGIINFASVIRNNETDTNETVLLPDGSQVILSPKSKLVYGKNNFSANRQVSLQGEAFFDVHRDPAHPFTVYTKSMVTKVLGTSFLVKEFNNDQTASIVVKTGRVSVFKEKNYTEYDPSSNQLTGIILTPNQQLTYTIANNELTKSIIEKPVILPKSRPVFNFRIRPVNDIFESLEEAYGINIIYDTEMVTDQTLSVSFGEEDFYQKLTIVCKAINASYEIVDGTVVISFKK